MHNVVLIFLFRFPKQNVRIKSSETYNKICGNLLYSLERMKLNSEKEAYIELVDSVVIGPANLHASDVENILGVNMEIFNHSKRKRNQMIDDGTKPTWSKKEERSDIATNRIKPSRANSLPTMRDSSRGHVYGKRKLTVEPRNPKRSPSFASSDLQYQFELFAKFGGSSSDGRQITLSQSDKWLRQAKVIDSWNVTTTDTAIAFRKISRGSIWLDYLAWREFLEEFTTRAKLDFQTVVDKLEACGEPSLTESTRLSAKFSI